MDYELGRVEMTDKIWDDHSEFLGDMAEQVTKLVLSDDDMLTAVRDYTAWLSKHCFIHAEKHCRDDKEVPSWKYTPGDITRGWGEWLKEAGP